MNFQCIYVMQAPQISEQTKGNGYLNELILAVFNVLEEFKLLVKTAYMFVRHFLTYLCLLSGCRSRYEL